MLKRIWGKSENMYVCIIVYGRYDKALIIHANCVNDIRRQRQCPLNRPKLNVTIYRAIVCDLIPLMSSIVLHSDGAIYISLVCAYPRRQ